MIDWLQERKRRKSRLIDFIWRKIHCFSTAKSDFRLEKSTSWREWSNQWWGNISIECKNRNSISFEWFVFLNHFMIWPYALSNHTRETVQNMFFKLISLFALKTVTAAGYPNVIGIGRNQTRNKCWSSNVDSATNKCRTDKE